ncbi:MAG TPA: ATPase, T2SS/T4P/T4SS family [Candidatus Eisenbacteria bacterium]|nr:ATPase, T2SS/T4P/T4SS family [Candidatus Eisenbacteria bacterium]
MNEVTVGQRPTITAILVDAGVVTEEQVQAGLALQRQTGRRIGVSLVELGFVSEEDIAWALAHQLGISFVDVRGDTLDAALVQAYPEHLLRRLQFVPIVGSEERLVVAAADPTDQDGLREMEAVAGTRVECVSATTTAIDRALDGVFGHRAGRRSRRAAPDPDVRYDVVWERSGESFLQFHLSLAMRLEATEIHFVHDGGAVQVFHRVGTHILRSPDEPAEVMDLLAARLEAFGMVAGGEQERHDCCSGVIQLDGREQPISASRLVGRDRTSITLQLLRDPGTRSTLDELGLDAVDVARLRQIVTEPSGLVLVCGPTGSGCSSTLAALLAELPTEEHRWLVFARDQRRWPAVPGLVDVLTGSTVRRWRRIAVTHGADGVVLDGGLEGRRVRSVLGSATHGRWVLARTNWEDTFSLIEWLARHPLARVPLARRLRAVIQQRLVVTPASEGRAAGHRAVFEVLFATDALRAAIQQGATGHQLSVLARADGFRTLGERVQAAVESGTLDKGEAARVLA